MKVLVVSLGYPPRGSLGTEFYTRELVRGLSARGAEVSVLHPDRDGAGPPGSIETVMEEGVPVGLLRRGKERKRFEASYRDERTEAAFAAHLARLRPDVVHFTYLLWGLSLRLPSVARGAGVASVLTLTDYGLLCHRGQMFDHRLERCFGPHPPAVCARCVRTPSPHDGPPGALLARRAGAAAAALLGGLGHVPTARAMAAREREVRVALGAADRLIAPTAVLADAFRRFGADPAKLEELVYAFDEEPYRAVRANAPPSTPRFAFLGQLAPHKGVATLVEAARALERRGSPPFEVALHGAGGGGRHRLYAPRVLAAAPGSVRLEPGFPADRAPEVLSGVSALVLPSEWDENAPLSILQARAAGVPVLASDVPGIREVVRPGVDGVLFPPRDAPALAAAMEEVIAGRVGRSSDPGLPLSLEEHLERVQELYRLACGRARGEAER